MTAVQRQRAQSDNCLVGCEWLQNDGELANDSKKPVDNLKWKWKIETEIVLVKLKSDARSESGWVVFGNGTAEEGTTSVK
jgi:hypothetical protein